MFARTVHLWVALSLLIVTISASGQPSPPLACPTISVNGPPGITDPGELETYSASVELNGTTYKPTFRWSVSTGEIVSGQGTSTISLRTSESTSTVTVELVGLPEGCEAVASETSCRLRPPDAVRIGEIRNIAAQDVSLIKRFAAELKDNPNNQGYVFVGHPVGLSKEKIDERERGLAKMTGDFDTFDGPRITIVTRENTSDFAEFWRVPPGADNPKCERCVETSCPTISVMGPVENPEPMAKIRFQAVIGGNSIRNIRYKWLVTNGKIIEGEETSAITVFPDRREGGVTATVEVDGLPKGCSTTATESSAIIDFPPSILMDEVDLPLTKIAEGVLRLAAQEQKDNPDHSLYIVAYSNKDMSQFDIRQGVKRVSDFLMKEMKLNSNDFEIVTEPSDKTVTKFYRIPPGADKPTP